MTEEIAYKMTIDGEERTVPSHIEIPIIDKLAELKLAKQILENSVSDLIDQFEKAYPVIVLKVEHEGNNYENTKIGRIRLRGETKVIIDFLNERH